MIGCRDTKDKWLYGIFVGMLANSVMIATWVPLLFVLEPGQTYRHMSGALISLLVVPGGLVYAIVLLVMRTKHYALKAAAVIMNVTPVLVIVLTVKLLAVMGHMPAE